MYLSNDFDDYTVVYSSTKKISQKTSASRLSNTPKIIEIGFLVFQELDLKVENLAWKREIFNLM